MIFCGFTIIGVEKADYEVDKVLEISKVLNRNRNRELLLNSKDKSFIFRHYNHNYLKLTH